MSTGSSFVRTTLPSWYSNGTNRGIIKIYKNMKKWPRDQLEKLETLSVYDKKIFMKL